MAGLQEHMETISAGNPHKVTALQGLTEPSTDSYPPG